MKGDDWSNLQELLNLIFKKLRHAGDVIRFEAVCLSWNRVSSEGKRRPLKLLSPLLLHPPTAVDGFHRFRDHSNNKVCELQLQYPGTPFQFLGNWTRRRCYITCNGWLVFQNCNLLSAIIFIYPMTRKEIDLPEFPINEQIICKAVASSSPSDPNCVVMAIYSSNARNLATWKPGDNGWKILTNTNHQHYKDIVYHKDKFYALNCAGVLYECEVNGNISVMQIAGEDRLYRCHSYRRYLVESSGDLLQIVKNLRLHGYSIRKMDFERREWIEVKSIGENALFLGKDQCFCVSTEEFSEFTADCIYSRELCSGCYNCYYYYDECFCKCNYVVACNMKTSETELYTTVPHPTLRFRSSWITPDLTLPEL